MTGLEHRSDPESRIGTVVHVPPPDLSRPSGLPVFLAVTDRRQRHAVGVQTAAWFSFSSFLGVVVSAALKAVTTQTTDQGVFEAIVSTDTVDRENDVVVPDAMVDALKAWTFTGKMVPLHWNHSAEPEDIVGHVNPATVKAVDGQVHASGWIDQSTERGRHVWRLAKAQTMGFSFGYIITASTKRADGGRTITQLDVFEISAVPAPMNPQTRVLSTKALDQDYEALRARFRDEMAALLTATPQPVVTKSVRPPVQIASFEC